MAGEVPGGGRPAGRCTQQLRKAIVAQRDRIRSQDTTEPAQLNLLLPDPVVTAVGGVDRQGGSPRPSSQQTATFSKTRRPMTTPTDLATPRSGPSVPPLPMAPDKSPRAAAVLLLVLAAGFEQPS